MNWKFIRKSLKVRKWDDAVLLVRKMETEGFAQRLGEYTISQAIELYLQDNKGRNLAPETLRTANITFNGSSKGFKGLSIVFGGKRFSEVRPADLLAYRAEWKLASATVAKRWERIRQFFNWAFKNKLSHDNPCDGLRTPKINFNPKLPYNQGQIERLLAVVANHPLAKALVLVLLYSGLRISDAVQLGPASLVGDSLRLRTMKTGADVRIPLPTEIISTLRGLPLENGRWFWNGKIKLTKRINNLRRMMNRFYTDAAIVNGGFQRFRDTAAVRWLEAGFSVQDVAVMLGNSALIVEKHYSAWVAERSERLESRIRATFNS